jgi:hypothetical protein
MPTNYQEADAGWEAEIQNPDSVEALSWLQGPAGVMRTLSGGDGSDSALTGDAALMFVQHLYQLGAKRVTALHIEGYEGQEEHQDTDSLVVELPEEAEPRKQIFDWKASFDEESGWDTEPDEGQKYMLVWWP